MRKNLDRSKSTEIMKGLGLMVTSVLDFLLVIEIIMRLTEPREIMRYFYAKDDPVLHHRFVPNSIGRYKTVEFDIDYTINSIGLRDREYAIDKPSKTYRILMLEDSFIEGDGVYSNETCAKRLEAILDTIRSYSMGSNQRRSRQLFAVIGIFVPEISWLATTA
ncbi:MAG: hypothetical protein O7D34_11815 [Ignavibacteria bacterium]|nr:hypothetical protein [Ignavibacteria bacterium]